jgi:hypothetical protein
MAGYIYLVVVFLLENPNVGKEKRSSYEWIPPPPLPDCSICFGEEDMKHIYP